MPRVPSYEAQIAPQALPGGVLRSTATANAFGAGEGQAMQQGGAALSDLGAQLMVRAEKMQEENDAAAVMEAYEGLSEQARALTMDPEKGLFARQGKNALGITKDATTALDKMGQTVLGGLANDRQRQALSKMWSRRREQELDSLSRHEMGQRKAYLADQTSALVQGAIEDGANHYNDPKRLDAARVTILNGLRANLAGEAPEVVQQKIEAATSKFHVNVIQRIADAGQNPAGAKAYYQAHKAEIDGNDHDQIDKLLKDGIARGQAQKIEDMIAGKMGAGNLAGMLEAARQVQDPALRDDVVSRVKTRFAEFEAVTRKAERDNADAAWGVVLQGGKVDQIPATVWAGIDPQAQKSMMDYAERQAKGQDNPKNDALYSDLYQMAAQDPAKFQDYDLKRHINDLPSQDFQELVRLQAGVVAKDAKAEAKRVTFDKALQRAKPLLIAAGIDPTPKDTDDKGAKRVALFQAQLARELDSFQAAKQGPATDEEVIKIIDGLLLKGVVRGTGVIFGDDEALAFERPAGKAFAVPFDEIPEADVAAIRAALAKAGKLPLETRRDPRTGKTTQIEGDAARRAIEDLYTRKRMQAR